MPLILMTEEKMLGVRGKSYRWEVGSLFKVCFLMRSCPPPLPNSPCVGVFMIASYLRGCGVNRELQQLWERGSRCGYLANYRNITQGFQIVAPVGRTGRSRIHGALGGTLSFPSLILITGELFEGRKSPRRLGKFVEPTDQIVFSVSWATPSDLSSIFQCTWHLLIHPARFLSYYTQNYYN